MSTRGQRWCAWCGPIFVVVFFGGMVLAGLFPPKSPHASTAHVVAFFREHTTRHRLGLLIVMASAGLTAPWIAVISTQLRRIEGQWSPMASTQLASGAAGIVIIIIAPVVWAVGAFRPEQTSPEILHTLYDFGWIAFVWPFAAAVPQSLAIAYAVLTDKHTPAVLPRWVGYLNLWVAFLFLPGGLLIFFHHGAFAWNGLLAFWVPAAVFGSWFIVMFVALRKAIAQQEAQAAPDLIEPPVLQPA